MSSKRKLNEDCEGPEKTKRRQPDSHAPQQSGSEPGIQNIGRIWTLGLSKSRNPCEYNRSVQKSCSNEGIEGRGFMERIKVPCTTTIFELVNFLCNGPVKDRREEDNGIDDHLWELKIISSGKSTHPRPSAGLTEGKKHELYMPQNGIGMFEEDELLGDEGAEIMCIKSLMKNSNALEVGGTIFLKYDLGSPTEIFLKVLSVEDGSNQNASISIQKDDHNKGNSPETVSDEFPSEDTPSENTEDSNEESTPPLRDTPILSREEDAALISKAKALCEVTALAVAQQPDSNSPVLYSGHSNGVMCKWNLTTNEKIWTRRVFPDWTERSDHGDLWALLGIRGIAVKKNDEGRDHVYTWSHNYEPDPGTPSAVKVLDGENGMLAHTLSCEVDKFEAHPLISCVVFSKLKYDSDWHDAVIVGLKATAEILEHDTVYTDFDIEEAEDFAYGNILPFVENETEESWRGHSGTIRSMAVMPDKYIVSCSECEGHELAEMILLWSAAEPGVPIHRLDLFQGAGSFHPITSLQGGISISGNKILLGCERGDMIVPIDIMREGDRTVLKMRGIAPLGQRLGHHDLSNGCMAGNGNYAVINQVNTNEVWAFAIKTVGDSNILDSDLETRDSSSLQIMYDDYDETQIHLRTRSIALGKVMFPPVERKENRDDRTIVGPHVLTMKGRWVVAGYECGSILKASLLPEEFEDETEGTNLHASTFLHNESCLCPHFDTLDHEPPQLPQPQCVIQ